MAVGPPQRLQVGDDGSAVLDVQARLIALGYPIVGERGTFGPSTASAVKAFQVRRGLVPDGVVEEHTWRELVEAGRTLGSRTLYLRGPGRMMRGDDVRELQRRLNALGFDAGKEDGILGFDTDRAIREFQKNMGLPSDGYAGHDTFDALDRLRRRIGPGSKAELRERLAREAAVGVSGRVIFLDPAHGGHDVGCLTSPGIPEAYVVYRVAESASEALAGRGATGLLSRAVQQGPDEDRRCESANARAADLAVSFHLACRPDPGPTVAFWSVEGRRSATGHELAEAIGESLRPRLGPTQILGRNLPFLRQTRMPAVVIDLACPSNDALLGEDPYLEALGQAVAAGIEQYFG
jgi:N-acetylmuramoyl-L-alanine amidase